MEEGEFFNGGLTTKQNQTGPNLQAIPSKRRREGTMASNYAR